MTENVGSALHPFKGTNPNVKSTLRKRNETGSSFLSLLLLKISMVRVGVVFEQGIVLKIDFTDWLARTFLLTHTHTHRRKFGTSPSHAALHQCAAVVDVVGYRLPTNNN